MPHSDFIHLHLHTQYSLLDGACRIKEILSLAAQYKMDSLAITDHGNMFGAIEFYMEAQKAGIKPIIGCEVYVAPKSRLDRGTGGIEDAANHLILLVKDETGYRNLMKLVSIGYLEGFYYRPRIDKEVLAQYSKGLIGLTACLKGEVAQLLAQKRFNDALKCADTYLNIMGGDNLYLELQPNSIPEQKIVNDGLVRISKELGLPLVATNDVHYLQKKDAAAHEALLCIQTQTTLDDPNRMRFATEEFYFTSPQEMTAAFKDVPEAIANTRAIAQRCNLELDFSKVHLPKYDPPGGKDKEVFLREICERGLTERFTETTPVIKERLEYELQMIKKMGFISYFLIVWDFIHYAKSKSIPVGPGRGSAAGSLVSYLLGITDLNPLTYGLLFERFLNPERISLPDIDIDFCYERRPEVIDYVTKKYGRQNVAQIITFGTMQARAVVRDVGRVMGISYADVDRIAKMIPPDPNMTLKDALTSEPELNNMYKNDPQITKLVNTALSLEGLNRHASVHAAGVVIGDVPLDNYMPIFKTGDDQVTSGYSMGILEKIGLLKVDFLGLRTLTVVSEAVKLIKEVEAKEIRIRDLPLDDINTYKLLALAHTIGVFQVESSGMRDLLKKLEPSRFEDVIALLALYRPGPIGSGMLDDFIQRKHGRVPIRYDHKKLEGVLKETYGIIVYQEQIMQIASTLAGFTMAQADLLRRAMSKKIPEVMEKQRSNFISGCIKNEISSSVANKVFDLIEYFSGYGFNKCVVGATEIIDACSGKYVSAKDIFDKKVDTRYTLGCSHDLKVVKARIDDIVSNGVKPVYKLRTDLGREITVTDNHPFFTFGGWKELGDLSIGERIALGRVCPVEGAEQMQEYKIIVLAGVLSEGNTCHHSGFYYYNNDPALVRDYSKNLEKFDNTTARISARRGRFEVYAGTGRDCRFYKGQAAWNKGFEKSTYDAAVKLIVSERSGARMWIEALGLHCKKATEKFIPTEVFSLSNRDIALFIGRLWSGDGFVYSDNNSIPFYASSSLRLTRQLQDLLLRFRITSRLTQKRFRYKYKGRIKFKIGYALYLHGNESIVNFLMDICPFIIGKDAQITRSRAYYRGVAKYMESKDTLPAQIRQVVKDEKDRLGLGWKQLEKRSGVSMKDFYGASKAYKKGFRRQTIRRIAEFLESERLMRFVNADISWDRVASIEYQGREETFDLEIDGIHNFIANGLIVHNSHSTAYALISYRTAYLKANYPVEFMTALLTSERDNTDKIVEYVAEAGRMGLQVVPPDINDSGAFFQVKDKATIRFGLLAVKNVGAGAVDSIIAARNTGGKFKSLEDLCQRIDLRLANRKVLEALIKCGAMDGFAMPRAQLFAGLDIILERSSRLQKEKAKGQFSFFDQIDGANGFGANTQIALPQVKEWPQPQLLAFEKDMLGFYISGHPLARYARQLKRFTQSSIGSLSAHKDEEEIKLVALIAKIKQTTTRAKQEKMAILKLEDLEGSVEALVFPRAYQKVSRYLLSSTVVMVRGNLNLKEDTPKILVNDLFPFEEIYKTINAISINLSGMRENVFESLKELLSLFHGTTPVYLRLDSPQKGRTHIVVGENFYVNPTEKLIQDVDELLGDERLSLVL